MQRKRPYLCAIFFFNKLIQQSFPSQKDETKEKKRNYRKRKEKYTFVQYILRGDQKCLNKFHKLLIDYKFLASHSFILVHHFSTYGIFRAESIRQGDTKSPYRASVGDVLFWSTKMAAATSRIDAILGHWMGFLLVTNVIIYKLF